MSDIEFFNDAINKLSLSILSDEDIIDVDRDILSKTIGSLYIGPYCDETTYRESINSLIVFNFLIKKYSRLQTEARLKLDEIRAIALSNVLDMSTERRATANTTSHNETMMNMFPSVIEARSVYSRWERVVGFLESMKWAANHRREVLDKIYSSNNFSDQD